MIGEDLTWKADTAMLHGKTMPRSVASTPDARTKIEIMGPPSAIRQIVVTGQILDEVGASQAAIYMAIAMRLILPQWDTVDTWLATSLRSVKKRPHLITMGGWRIRMRWIADLHTVALQATR